MVGTWSRLGSVCTRSTLIPIFLICGAGSAAASTHYDSTPGSCLIIGDQDVYGIGIRLSYYLQWVAVLFGMWIAPANNNQIRTATNILTISVFINSLRGASVEHSLMVVEWYIVEYLAFVLLAFNLPTSWRALTRSLGSLAVLFINYFVVAFPVWLYWRGVNLGRKAGCQPNVFFFTSIGAYNPAWIIVCKVLSTIGLILLPGCLIVAWLLFSRRDKLSREADEDGMDKWTVPFAGTFTVFLLVNGAIAIAFVEMTIKSNKIEFPDTRLTDSGQLIPLLIGVFTLASAFWEGLKKWVS